jgi:hypothetical protein
MTVVFLQKNLFEGLGIVHTAAINVDFRRGDGAPMRNATIKVKGGETETLPLFSNKDGIVGEVSQLHCALLLSGLLQYDEMGAKRRQDSFFYEELRFAPSGFLPL